MGFFLFKIERMSGLGLYLKNAVSHPLKTASLMPSSEKLCNIILDEADVSSAGTIVEFGSGTGVATEKIVEQMDPSASLVIIEINSDFAKETQRRFPRAAVFNCCASKTTKCLESLGISGCDRIVSGLPWAVFGDGFQKKLLFAAQQALNPGGIFVSFAYKFAHMFPSGKGFKRNLEAAFSEVTKTKTEWRNVPPAFVYRARK